mmetsp:Transcript_27736/g.31126  ORF Transcript_27736/g.31126 Transcript_27736/m.31126 type:complete len:148 (+) Transcript_27736:43-486(+)
MTSENDNINNEFVEFQSIGRQSIGRNWMQFSNSIKEGGLPARVYRRIELMSLSTKQIVEREMPVDVVLTDYANTQVNGPRRRRLYAPHFKHVLEESAGKGISHITYPQFRKFDHQIKQVIKFEPTQYDPELYRPAWANPVFIVRPGM